MTQYKLVPVEPTPEMVEAARKHHEGDAYLPSSLYAAMLAAAPEVQAEPVAWMGVPVMPGRYKEAVFCSDKNLAMQWDYSGHLGLGRLIVTPLYAAPQPKAEQQEPFEYWTAVEGWVKAEEVRSHFESVGCGTIYKNPGEGRIPLYTSPAPSRQPLTDEEIDAAMRKALGYGLSPSRDDLDFARAIEAAHGIGSRDSGMANTDEPVDMNTRPQLQCVISDLKAENRALRKANDDLAAAAIDWPPETEEMKRLQSERDELLGALKAAHLELHYCSQQLVAEGWTEGSTVRKALDGARAAIARAEGRS